MKVSFTKSLGTRIFALIAFLVTATVAGTTWQTSNQFKKVLTDLTKNDLNASTSSAAYQIQSTLQTWIASLTTLQESNPPAQNKKDENTNDSIVNFLKSNREFIALHTHQYDQKTGTLTVLNANISKLDDARFAGKAREESLQEIDQSVTDTLQKNKSHSTEIFLTPPVNTRIPLVHLILRYRSNIPDQAIFVTLTAWNSSLISSFNPNENLFSYLVNRRGEILAASTTVNEFNLTHHAVYKRAHSKNAPGAGLLEGYKNSEGSTMFGSYSSIPQFHLSVISETSSAHALMFVEQSFKQSVLYGALFLLIGIFLTYFAVTTTMRQLVEVTNATQKIAAGQFAVSVPIRFQDEVGLLAANVSYMAKRIVYLMHQQVEAARTQKELETAKMVQSMFFPRGGYASDKINIGGFYQPASECGGDLWGTFKIGDHKHGIFIADAMGHGVPAALLTAMAFSAYKMVESILKDHDSFKDSPALMLAKINEMIYSALAGKIHMTFFLAFIDLESHTMVAANAGHNIPMLIPHAVDDPRLKKRKKNRNARDFISLQVNGLPLGLEEKVEYQDKTFDLRLGDKIFLFTDGLIECTNAAGVSWGRKILLDKVLGFADHDANTLAQAVISDAFTFFNHHPLKDDITVVSVEIIDPNIKYQPKPQAQAPAAKAPVGLPNKRPALPNLTNPANAKAVPAASIPPVSRPPVSTPPVTTAPISSPPVSAPKSVPPKSAPPKSLPPVSAPPLPKAQQPADKAKPADEKKDDEITFDLGKEAS